MPETLELAKATITRLLERRPTANVQFHENATGCWWKSYPRWFRLQLSPDDDGPTFTLMLGDERAEGRDLGNLDHAVRLFEMWMIDQVPWTPDPRKAVRRALASGG